MAVKTADGWTISTRTNDKQLLTRTSSVNEVCYLLVDAKDTNVASAHQAYGCAGPNGFTIEPQIRNNGLGGIDIYGPAQSRVSHVEIDLRHKSLRADSLGQGFLVELPQTTRSDVLSIRALDHDGHALVTISGRALPPAP